MAENKYAEALKVLEEFAIRAPEIRQMELAASDAVTGPSVMKKLPIVLSNQTDKSEVRPRFITVGNVDDLKKIGGIPDRFYDEGWEHERDMPQAPTAKVLATDNPYHPDICAALRAYIYGDSRRVAQYRDAINRLRFPMSVGVFAANDMIVTKDSPLIINDDEGHGNPIAVIFDTVTVYKGGQIIWNAPGKMTCNKLIYDSGPGPAQDDSLTDTSDGSYISEGGYGGDGGDGGKGADITEASPDGNPGVDNKNSCKTPALAGSPGTDGGEAGDASDGGKGGTAEEIYVDVEELTGTIKVGSNGGKGGKGGKGGDGGKGGNGGKGGAATSNCAGAKGGNAGNGGKAGKGGKGGDGGDGGKIFITYKSGNPQFQQVSKGGDAGDAGDAGNPGAPGTPGQGTPNGDKGEHGAKAEPSGPGNGGKPGQVFINGKKLPE